MKWKWAAIFLTLVVGCSSAVEEVSKKRSLTLYKFGFPGCVPCQQMNREFWNTRAGKNLTQDFQQFKKWDTTTVHGAEMARRYNVKSVPCVIVLENGRVIGRKSGYRRGQFVEYYQWLSKFVR